MAGKGLAFKVEEKPIFEVFLLRFKEAWYDLSGEAQKELLDKLTKNHEEVGAKSILMCHCRWSNEEWGLVGVTEYPDIEAVQRHHKFTEELPWYRYVEAKMVLGTRIEFVE